jgi:hypothetical protein
MVELEMQLHAETPQAILVSEDGDEDNAVWLPKSQIESEDNWIPGEVVVFSCPQWLAQKRGLA